MSFFPIPKKKFNKDKPPLSEKEARKQQDPMKGHWSKKRGIRRPTQLKSDKMRWIYHCPRSCQQKANGNRGKRTFDGIQCNSCGYKR